MPALPDPVELRIHIYDVLLATGRPPSLREMARAFASSESEMRHALGQLNVGKTVLQHPQTGEVWMAGPFAAGKTDYRVSGRRTTWFANCAWDMFGVPMIVGERVVIHAKCGDCGDPIRLVGDPHVAPRDDLVVHFLVPARRWYDDLGFT